MDIGSVAATVGSICWAVILTNAAAAKLALPQRLQRALTDLTIPGVPSVNPAVVRAVAIVELLVAVGLLLLPAKLPVVLATVILGTSFAVLGVAGWSRHSELPCGCLGSSDSPLGPVNIVAGAALVLVGALNSVFPIAWSADIVVSSILSSTIGSVLLAMWLRREPIRRLVDRNRTSPGRV